MSFIFILLFPWQFAKLAIAKADRTSGSSLGNCPNFADFISHFITFQTSADVQIMEPEGDIKQTDQVTVEAGQSESEVVKVWII